MIENHYWVVKRTTFYFFTLFCYFCSCTVNHNDTQSTVANLSDTILINSFGENKFYLNYFTDGASFVNDLPLDTAINVYLISSVVPTEYVSLTTSDDSVSIEYLRDNIYQFKIAKNENNIDTLKYDLTIYCLVKQGVNLVFRSDKYGENKDTISNYWSVDTLQYDYFSYNRDGRDWKFKIDTSKFAYTDQLSF